jgi:Uma2 family endonuclease
VRERPGNWPFYRDACKSQYQAIIFDCKNFKFGQRLADEMETGDVMLENTQAIITQADEMPSLNHSYICAQVMRQLLQDDSIQPLPELTLDIENGLTPDISVFKKEKIRPNFFEDVLKVKDLPILAIEVISSSQSIQAILEKSNTLVKSGIKTVWTVEPYGRSIFVVTKEGKKLFHENMVESDGIKVDFTKVFKS